MTPPPPTAEQRRMAVAYVAGLCDDDRTACTWQTFDDTGKDWRRARIQSGSLREVGGQLVAANLGGCGVFCTVAQTDLQGRKAANVVKIRALFADFDGVTPKPPHLPPSMIIQSGSGQHWYWRVGDCPLDAFAVTQKRIALHYGSDPVVHDLPRVMRVPGFWHLKRDPFMVSLVTSPGHVYRISHLLDGLPPLPDAPKPVARRFDLLPGQPARGWRGVDPLRAFLDSGMYGRDLGGGKHAVICPWLHEHTRADLTGKTGDCVLWEASATLHGIAVFRCEHSHCQTRYLAHALAAIGAIDPHP